MLANRRNGTIYIGVTSDLIKRVFEHRSDSAPGFTQRYRVHALVWYELHQQMNRAILREKQLKKWARNAKVRLIESMNPSWADLWPELTHA